MITYWVFISCMQALNCLRRAKLLDSLLSKREAALENVENILGQIQMAETDAMVRLSVLAQYILHLAQYKC